MEFLERFDQEIVDGKPDRSTPIRIAAEESRARFGRFIVHSMVHAHRRQDIGMIFVIAREGADAIGRQEFLFVQHVPQHGFQPVAVHQ